MVEACDEVTWPRQVMAPTCQRVDKTLAVPQPPLFLRLRFDWAERDRVCGGPAIILQLAKVALSRMDFHYRPQRFLLFEGQPAHRAL